MSISGTIRTLHVDDDPSLGDLTAEFLEQEQDNLEVVTETRASEAIERLERNEDSIDCIVSDYEMPGMDGLEFLEAVREIDEELPFILFTGKGSEEIAADAITEGVTDYLQKGGTEQYVVLANRVRNSVEQYQAARVEKRLREIADETNDVLWMFSADGEPLFVNSTVDDVIGISRPQLHEDPRQFLEVVHPDDRATVEHATDRLLDGESVELEHRIVRDDDQRWVQVQAQPLYEEESVDRIVGFTRDITDRKERELSLERSRERLRVLFEEAPDQIAIHDRKGNVLDVNKQNVSNLGYSRSELTAMNVADYEVGYDRDELLEMWNAMKVGETVKGEGRHERKDGSTFPVEVWVNKIQIDGEPRYIAQARDITDRKERERELRRTSERYRSLFENNPLVLWEEDLSAAKAYVDRLAARTDDLEAYLEKHPDELQHILEKVDVIDVNQNAVDYYRADTKEDLLADIGQLQTPESMETNRRMWAAIADGKTEFRGESVAQRLDGTTRHQLIEMKVPEIHTDDYSRVYIIGTDITEQKEREQKLQRQSEQFDNCSSAVTQYLETVLEDIDPEIDRLQQETDHQSMKRTKRNLDGLKALIEDVQTFGQSDTIDEVRSIEVGKITANCWEELETKQATLDLRTELTVDADPGLLRQLFEELLTNSVIHGGDDVTIAIGDLDGEEGFYIEDNGNGIPEDDRESVFTIGYSTVSHHQSAGTGLSAGTGYGLPIVEEVVTAHGWEIEVFESDTAGVRTEIIVDSPEAKE